MTFIILDKCQTFPITFFEPLISLSKQALSFIV